MAKANAPVKTDQALPALGSTAWLADWERRIQQANRELQTATANRAIWKEKERWAAWLVQDLNREYKAAKSANEKFSRRET